MKNDHYPFDDDFQRRFAGLMLTDLSWARRVYPLIDHNRFTLPEVSLFVDLGQRVVESIHEAPTIVEIRQELRRAQQSGEVRRRVVATTSALFDAVEEGDLSGLSREYASEILTEVIRHERFLHAFDESLKLAKEKKYGEVVRLFEDAHSVLRDGYEDSLGMGVGLKDRQGYPSQSLDVERVPTYVEELDSALGGGLGCGHLGVLCGLPKSGKTQALTHFGLRLALAGYSTVYYTMEVSEPELMARSVAAFSGKEINDVRGDAEALGALHDRLREVEGAFITKHMRPRLAEGTPSVRDIRRHLRWLAGEWSVTPSLIIIDYMDIFSPVEVTGNRYADLGTVCTDMRELAEEMDVPVWTASQPIRGASDKEIIEIQDLAESWKKAHIADLVVGIGRTPDEKQAKQVRLYIAASRFSEDAVELGPFSTSYSQGRFIDDGWD